MSSRTDGWKSLAARLGAEPESGPFDLAQTLEEMGPNSLSDLADDLQRELSPETDESFYRTFQEKGRFREALAKFLAGRDAAFAGAVALRTYRARRIVVEDYDVLVDVGLERGLRDFLSEQGAARPVRKEGRAVHRLPAADLRIRVRVPSSPLEAAALRGARREEWRDLRLRVVSPDHLAALLVAEIARSKARPAEAVQDLARLMAGGEAAHVRVRRLLDRTAPRLVRVLDALPERPVRPSLGGRRGK